MICIIYECIYCFYSLLDTALDWAVMWCLYLLYLHYTLLFSALYSFDCFALSSSDAPQESCLGNVVNLSTL